MKTHVRAMQCALLSLGLLAVSPLSAANKYLTPTGAGAQNGTSWANAFSVSQLQAAVTGLAAGDTLNLGSGTYNVTSPTNITGSGSAGNPKVIQGVDTGGGLPLFQGNYDPNVAAADSTSFFMFGTGAIAHWQFKNFRIKNYSRGFRLWASGTTYTLRNNLLWDNVDGDSVEDFIQIYNASNVLIKNCDVIRYCKKAFRFGTYTMQITFEACTADAKGAPLFAGDLPLGQDSSSYPTRSIPAGFQGMDAPGGIIHDITFIDCVARNNRYYPQDNGDSGYWNGDGFVIEEGTYNVTFIRCKSFNNHDGGFDDKSDNASYTDCVAIGNGKGFRYWGNSGTYINCVSAYNKAYNYPNTNNSDGMWVGRHPSGAVGVAHVYGSTFHNNFKFALETYDGGLIYATDCILSNKEAPEYPSNYFDSTYLYSSSGVTLTNTALYHVDRGQTTDPLYIAASKTWEGSPANAYDSALYSPGQGYYGLGGGSSTPVVTIAATDSSAGEPSNGGTFTLTASPAPASAITVNVSTSGTASSGSDYTALAGTVTIGTSGVATVNLAVIDDSTTEGNETVVLTVNSGTGYTVGSPAAATVNLADNDTGPVVTIAATDTSAGEPSNHGTFTLTASPAPSSPITVNLTRSGTATNGTDYTSIASTVTIGTGGTATVTVTVTNDTLVEGNETVILQVASGSGYSVGTPDTATVTIADDDTAATTVKIQATDPSAGEPINNARFTVTATPAPSSPITVNLAVSGTATNGSDYTTIANSVTIGTGGSELIYVTPIDDSLVEGSETVNLAIATGSGYTIGSPNNATVTMTDNDSGGSTPTVSIAASDSAAGEPSNNGTFTLTASPAPSSPITVNLSISGSATNGSDYSTIANTVTIGTGGSATVNVAVINDTAAESSETVVLGVSSGTGYTVGSPGSATVNISDNDSGGGTPVVSVVASDNSAGEPSNHGAFTFTASPAPSSPLTVNLSFYGSASNGNDYVTIPNTVTIGTSGTATVTLTVIDDSTVEGTETASVSIAGGSGYGVVTPSNATITITSND